MFNKSQFKFSETFNNSNGKTSGSGFLGVILGIITGVSFIAGTIGWFLNITDVMEFFDKVLQLGFLSSILLGVRKIAGTINNNKEENKIEKPSEI